MTASHTRPMTFEEYEETPEANSHQELHFGWIVREEPDARWHQAEALWLAMLLFAHVRERALGLVLTAPTGVVLDRDKSLVLEPDMLILLEDRMHLLGRHVDGPPNLVVEVASPSTKRRDREEKLQWYRAYGVQECWLVDTHTREIEVFDLEAQPTETSRIFRGQELFQSRVLPDFLYPTSDLFDRRLREMLERSSYDKD